MRSISRRVTSRQTVVGRAWIHEDVPTILTSDDLKDSAHSVQGIRGFNMSTVSGRATDWASNFRKYDLGLVALIHEICLLISRRDDSTVDSIMSLR